MIYREFKPDILLCPYIDTYWAINGFAEKEEFHKILPDGCVDIIFSINEDIQFGLMPFIPNIVFVESLKFQSRFGLNSQ